MTKIPSQIQLILNHKGKEITIKNDGSIIDQICNLRNLHISNGKKDSFLADFEKVTLDSKCVKNTFINLIKFEKLDEKSIIDTFLKNYGIKIYTKWDYLLQHVVFIRGFLQKNIYPPIEKTKSTLSKLSDKYECFIKTPDLSELIIYFSGNENPVKFDNDGSIIDQICNFRNEYVAKGKKDSFFDDFERITLDLKCVKNTFIDLIKSEKLNEDLIIDTFSKNCSIRIYTKWNCVPQNIESIKGFLQKNNNNQLEKIESEVSKLSDEFKGLNHNYELVTSAQRETSEKKSTKDLFFFLSTLLPILVILVFLIYSYFKNNHGMANSPTKDEIAQSLASIVDNSIQKIKNNGVDKSQDIGNSLNKFEPNFDKMVTLFQEKMDQHYKDLQNNIAAKQALITKQISLITDLQAKVPEKSGVIICFLLTDSFSVNTTLYQQLQKFLESIPKKYPPIEKVECIAYSSDVPEDIAPGKAAMQIQGTGSFPIRNQVNINEGIRKHLNLQDSSKRRFVFVCSPTGTIESDFEKLALSEGVTNDFVFVSDTTHKLDTENYQRMKNLANKMKGKVYYHDFKDYKDFNEVERLIDTLALSVISRLYGE